MGECAAYGYSCTKFPYKEEKDGKKIAPTRKDCWNTLCRWHMANPSEWGIAGKPCLAVFLSEAALTNAQCAEKKIATQLEVEQVDVHVTKTDSQSVFNAIEQALRSAGHI